MSPFGPSASFDEIRKSLLEYNRIQNLAKSLFVGGTTAYVLQFIIVKGPLSKNHLLSVVDLIQ